MLSVREIMHDGVVGIGPEANLHDLAQLLAQEQISGVPVLGPGNELLGVVSATDLIVCSAIHGQPDAALHWDQFQVEDIMTPVVVTATPNMSIPELARSMAESHIHRALVTENGKLLGIVTTFDIMRATAEPAAGEQGHTHSSPAEPESNNEMEPGFW